MVETLDAVFLEGRVFRNVIDPASARASFTTASDTISGRYEPLPSVGSHGEKPCFITTTVMANLRHQYFFNAGGVFVMHWGEPRDEHKNEFSRFAIPADP